MSVRWIGWGLLLAWVALVMAGCAVGRFIAGAPSTHERARHASGASLSRQTLLLRRCSGCHEVPDPSAMSALAWRTALDRMKERMRLPESEWDSLSAMARPDADGEFGRRP